MIHSCLVAVLTVQILINFVTHPGVLPVTTGSFSNDDGDGNQDVKKAIGLDWQNDNFARASHFFVHFFTVTA